VADHHPRPADAQARLQQASRELVRAAREFGDALNAFLAVAGPEQLGPTLPDLREYVREMAAIDRLLAGEEGG
jgi:hypothetical protein